MSQAFPDKVSIMRIRIVFVGATFVFVSVIPLRAADPAAQSQADRLRNLEQAVQQLQQRNAELEGEVKQLKAKSGPFAPILSTPEGKATAGNENKAVFTAPSPPPVYVVPGGAEYKLTLGGYLQMNAEGGDVSAFNPSDPATIQSDDSLPALGAEVSGAERFNTLPSNSTLKSKAISGRATVFPAVAPLFPAPTFSLTGMASRRRI